MSMRRLTIVLFAIAVLSTPAFAQPAATPTAEPTAVADIVEKSTRALNFREGDLDSLRNAESGFTAAGWAQFLKGLTGFIDDNGAPQFNSEFVKSGDAQVAARENGRLRVSLPGTLKHSHGKSSTTYQVMVAIEAGGQPTKIERLTWTAVIGGR